MPILSRFRARISIVVIFGFARRKAYRRNKAKQKGYQQFLNRFHLETPSSITTAAYVYLYTIIIQFEFIVLFYHSFPRLSRYSPIFYARKKPRRTRTEPFPKTAIYRLSLFVAITAGTFFSVAIARIAHVDFRQGTIIARTVVLTIGHGAANTHIYVFFMHHKNNPPSLTLQAVCANFRFPIDIFKIFL